MSTKIRLIILFGLCLSLSFSLLGCGKSNNPKKVGGTYEEPVITVEYLAGEYAEQLVRDGAVILFGTIEVVKDENGNPFLVISEKEIVTDETNPKGYYIADKNLESTYPLSYEARTTHLPGKTSIATIMTAENFVEAVETDVKLDKELAGKKFYSVYVMGDQAEMVLAYYIGNEQ